MQSGSHKNTSPRDLADIFIFIFTLFIFFFHCRSLMFRAIARYSTFCQCSIKQQHYVDIAGWLSSVI